MSHACLSGIWGKVSMVGGKSKPGVGAQEEWGPICQIAPVAQRLVLPLLIDILLGSFVAPLSSFQLIFINLLI